MNKMSIDDFCNTVASEIKFYLPRRYEDAEITLDVRVKNNDTVAHGIIIRNNNFMTPILYLDGYYDRYDGNNFGRLMDEIAKAYVDNDTEGIHGENDAQEIVNSMTNYNAMKDRIICRLLNADMNMEYIKNKPFTRIDDFVVTYHVYINGNMSIPITNTIMDIWEISSDELYELSIANMERITPHDFSDMESVLRGMMMEEMIKTGMSREDAEIAVEEFMPPIPAEEKMYVLSNKNKMYGASAILNSDVMDEIREVMDSDFYVIPSSIHECIIVPMKLKKNEIESMIRQVNEEQVLPSERLSNYVYAYDANARRIYRVV